MSGKMIISDNDLETVSGGTEIEEFRDSEIKKMLVKRFSLDEMVKALSHGDSEQEYTETRVNLERYMAAHGYSFPAQTSSGKK